MLKNFDNILHAVVSFGTVAKNHAVIFCHASKRTNGNKIAVDVAIIAVCANCVERLMPLIFATRQTNATSAEITPAKGAFVANVKREQSKQLALKNFFRQVATRQINATSAEITPAKGAFVAKVKPEHGEQRALKNFFRKFSPRQTNATSAEISPAKGAFVAKVKPKHGEQRALKTFFRQVATNTNATTLQCKTAL